MANRATAKCDQQGLLFSSHQGRKVQVDFGGGDVSSDGGLLLLREVERKLDIVSRAAKLFDDPRDPARVTHTIESLFKQRIFALAQGYEDLNDHQLLKNDPLLAVACEKGSALASPPTLCRMENAADKNTMQRFNHLLVDLFIESQNEAPEELILDFDATDDPTHGAQEGRFFHGYYGHYCFLPLYVFCGSYPLCALLRPANIDGARGAWAVLKLLTKRLRAKWLNVRIILRADSGFCRHRMLDWCDTHAVDYIVGLARNAKVTSQLEPLLDQAKTNYEITGNKQRLFTWLYYGAGTWSRERLVVGKAEHTGQGANPRYIVTSLSGDAQDLYDRLYCARGDMENRIKEQQLGLFADRTSCHRWWPNQLRLLLSTLAYVLIDELRRHALSTSEWSKKQVSTLRSELLKVGAVIVQNTRRVVVHLSSSWPNRDVFHQAWRHLTMRT